MAQKPSLPQGTRDFGPLVVQRRKYILQVIENVFKKYGFMPLETPAMEQLSTLSGKYGDEGDQLLYKILNTGDYLKKLSAFQTQGMEQEEMDKTLLPSFDNSIENLDAKRSLPYIAEKGLRYDLTVPFARYVTMNRNSITLPFKRYQMQTVWRADKPQKGRYREFWQCDADVIGSDSLLNEAELIKMYDEVFAQLNLPVIIKVNNRKLLSALATHIKAEQHFTAITVAIDKLDKIGLSGVSDILVQTGLNSEQIEQIIKFLNLGKEENPIAAAAEMLEYIQEGNLGILELLQLQKFLNHLEPVNTIQFDFTLARGLSYYTGAIVEVQANVGSFKSSIGGGGRYDNLTGIFGMPGISGVGVSFGLDRIYDVMEEQGLFPTYLKPNTTKILFCYFDEATQMKAVSLCAQLRKNDISAEVYPELTKKIGKQFEYANKLQINFACIIGETELNSNTLQVKNLESGEQQPMEIETLIKLLQS